MKTWKVAGVVLVCIAALALLGGCATGKYMPRADEELYGTWINEKTPNRDEIQKTVYGAGVWKEYGRVSSPNAVAEGTLRIDRKWVDERGNICYEAFCSRTTGLTAGYDFQVLFRLSKSATVLEYVWKASPQSDKLTYPSTIEPSSGAYHIFYRQV